MNQKIDSPARSQISRGFLTVLTILTILVLTVTVIIDRSTSLAARESNRASLTRSVMLFPWIIAAGQTIENGVNEFRGKIPEVVPTGIRAAAVGGLCLTFIVLPTIYLFRWRERRLRVSARTHTRPLTISGLVYGFFEVVTMFFVVAVIPIAVIQQNVRTSGRSAQAIQSNRDDIIRQIDRIGSNIRQYLALPKSMAGGNGSCATYVLPEEFKKTTQASFSVQVINDTVTVRAQSLQYPSAGITVAIPCGEFDTGRPHRRWVWEYEGEFQ
jgi:hypothetical protein